MDNRMVVTERYNAFDYGDMNEGKDPKDMIYYTTLAVEDLYIAMNKLTESELKLWLALMSNENMFSWDLYYKQIKLRTGLSKRSYYRAFEGLERKQYLNLLPDGRYVCRMNPMKWIYDLDEVVEESCYP